MRVWIVVTGDYNTEAETIRGVYTDEDSAEAAADAYNDVVADPYEFDPRTASVESYDTSDGVLPTHRKRLTLKVNIGPDGIEYGAAKSVDLAWSFRPLPKHSDDTNFTIDRQRYKGTYASATASYPVDLNTHLLTVKGTDHEKVRALYAAKLAEAKSKGGAGL